MRALMVAATVALGLVAAAFVVSPSRADASTYKHCGSAGTVYSGAVKLADVRAMNIACRKARRFARRFTLKSSPETGYRCDEDFYCMWRGWSCRNDGRHGDLKHRCETVNTTTHRVMVVKWVDRDG